MQLKNEVKKYFSTYFDSMDELFEEYSDETLAFSFQMGMPPEECRGMQVEPEFSAAELREFEEIESAVAAVRREMLK